jgi:hypothetical protein
VATSNEKGSSLSRPTSLFPLYISQWSNSMTMEKQRNEGEGNRTAAREYNRATKEFARTGQVEKQAERARQAIEESQKAELDRAEQAGKSKSRAEDRPLLHKNDAG